MLRENESVMRAFSCKGTIGFKTYTKFKEI